MKYRGSRKNFRPSYFRTAQKPCQGKSKLATNASVFLAFFVELAVRSSSMGESTVLRIGRKLQRASFGFHRIQATARDATMHMRA